MTEQAVVPDLSGRVALVTGGGRGLGGAAALALAGAGADVALLGRSGGHLESVAGAIRQRGQHAVWATADVSDWGAVREAIAEMSDALGPADILINNAATTGFAGRLETLDPDAWATTLAVNLNGPFHCVRATLGPMRERGWGRIINITSGAGSQPLPGGAAYSASKAGLDHLTRTLAAELVGASIAVIALSPGMMDTEMQERIRGIPGPDTDFFRTAHTAGMLRPPEEAAALVCWLCGPGGDTYSGQIVNVLAPEIRQRAGLPTLER